METIRAVDAWRTPIVDHVTVNAGRAVRVHVGPGEGGYRDLRVARKYGEDRASVQLAVKR